MTFPRLADLCDGTLPMCSRNVIDRNVNASLSTIEFPTNTDRNRSAVLRGGRPIADLLSSVILDLELDTATDGDIDSGL